MQKNAQSQLETLILINKNRPSVPIILEILAYLYLQKIYPIQMKLSLV
jgi:hypothetical protein